jgi:outer membrane lipoprotein SlyB
LEGMTMAGDLVPANKTGRQVVAIYRGMKPAREAVTHLDRAGIEASDISVVPQKEEDVEDTSLRDARVVGNVSKRVVVASAVSAVAGGLVGWALGTAFFDGVGIWVAVVAGAVAGSLFGGFLGGMAGLSMSDDWELTFESLRGGQVAIVVASDDPEELANALEPGKQQLTARKARPACLPKPSMGPYSISWGTTQRFGKARSPTRDAYPRRSASASWPEVCPACSAWAAGS